MPYTATLAGPSNFAEILPRLSRTRCRRQSSWPGPPCCSRRSWASAAGSSCFASARRCSWGLILLFVFGVTLHFLPFTGQVSPGLPAPRVTGFLLLDSLLAGRFDVFWSACQHLILPAA